jgi:hypothetical protein
MTSQENLNDSTVFASNSTSNIQPRLMTVMELLKKAFISGASTGGTQWTGELNIEADNRWVNFAHDIKRDPAAAHLINPTAQTSDHKELIAALLVAGENLDCEASGAGDACREAIIVMEQLTFDLMSQSNVLVNFHSGNETYNAAQNAFVSGDRDDLREAAMNLIACASDTYKKGNGHLGSFEDETGEKCWIVPFDAFESLRSAVDGNTATDVLHSQNVTEHQPNAPSEDDTVEAMVLSLCNPFPAESLGRTGDIDDWRGIMRKAYRAAAPMTRKVEAYQADAKSRPPVSHEIVTEDMVARAQKAHDSAIGKWQLYPEAPLSMMPKPMRAALEAAFAAPAADAKGQ